MPITASPSFSSDSVRCEPMKPAHPVTSANVNSASYPRPHESADTTGALADLPRRVPPGPAAGGPPGGPAEPSRRTRHEREQSGTKLRPRADRTDAVDTSEGPA